MGELFIRSLILFLFAFPFSFKENGIYTYIYVNPPHCVYISRKKKKTPSHPQPPHKKSPQVHNAKKNKKTKKKFIHTTSPTI